ncbi:flavodoxin domain-containing protein, partial [Paracoccus sp. PXZ]
LTEAGQSVHVGPMSAFTPERYTSAQRIILLAATYGDGAASASAKGFLDRLNASDRAPNIPLAVLGFGDRSFPAYCAFARDVAAAAQAKGWPELLALDTIDRQSPQDFARWGRALGDVLGIALELSHQPVLPTSETLTLVSSPQDFARWGRALGDVLGIALELSHQPVLPTSETLTLVSRRDYGAEVQAPTAILRFALPRVSLWQRLLGGGFARFQAGDLIGILPEGGSVPRLYSLASGRRDGFIEIVVKRHPGGLCSGQLTALEPGETVSAFLRPNPGFRPG